MVHGYMLLKTTRLSFAVSTASNAAEHSGRTGNLRPCTLLSAHLHLSDIRTQSTNVHVHCVRSGETDSSRATANTCTTDSHSTAWACSHVLF
jgi:hypothetical protein